MDTDIDFSTWLNLTGFDEQAPTVPCFSSPQQDTEDNVLEYQGIGSFAFQPQHSNFQPTSPSNLDISHSLFHEGDTQTEDGCGRHGFCPQVFSNGTENLLFTGVAEPRPEDFLFTDEFFQSKDMAGMGTAYPMTRDSDLMASRASSNALGGGVPIFNLDDVHRTECSLDSTACSANITPVVRQSGQKRRGRLNPLQRSKAKAVQRIRACMLCRMSKESVRNPTEFRKSAFGQIRAELPRLRWSSANLSTYVVQVKLINAKSPNAFTLKLWCREFIPDLNDVPDLHLCSERGPRKQILPPYAIYDTDTAKQEIEAFAEQHMSLIEEQYLEQVSDDVTLLTRREAQRFAKLHHESAVVGALKIRNLATDRRFETLNGQELGIPVNEDNTAEKYGQRPLPRYVNHQLDIILYNFIIERHRRDVFARLNKLIFGKNAISAWYEIFLTVYMLLETLEFA
ncbi:hypothetical protein ACLMJK_004302 [Lecanora helva]